MEEYQEGKKGYGREFLVFGEISKLSKSGKVRSEHLAEHIKLIARHVRSVCGSAHLAIDIFTPNIEEEKKAYEENLVLAISLSFHTPHPWQLYACLCSPNSECIVTFYLLQLFCLFKFHSV